MSEPALCQCLKCHRYLATNRLDGGSWLNNHCVECTGSGGLPLATLRGTLTDPNTLEILALISEECAEIVEAADISKAAGRVIQRVNKIIRWGWEADFEGTTQQHKLEVEIGDLVAVIAIALHNDLLSEERIIKHAETKMQKFQEDALGPRQRLLHADVPGVK